jgi:hypothetical protein
LVVFWESKKEEKMPKTIFTQIIIAVLLTLTANDLTSQEPTLNQSFKSKPDQRSAVGLRFGGTSGINYKHHFNSVNGVELIVGRTRYSYGITGLYEHHIATTVEALNVYIGGGAHISKPYAGNYLVNDSGNALEYSGGYNYSNNIFGVDGIIGLEFLFDEVPISLSADLKPYAEFFRWSKSSLVRLDPGLSLRYRF